MRRGLIGLSMIVALCLSPILVKADDASDRQAAAMQLLETMHMDKVLSDTTTAMIDMQIRQNPTIGPYRQIMLDFLKKYMGWDASKDDLAKLYADDFTLDELKEMITFYKTPTGQKLAAKQSDLATKGAEFGQKRVAEHQQELQQAIEAEAKKNQK